MTYQVDCSVLLTGEKFWELTIWNMFCRKKSFTVMLAVVYALGLGMVIGGIPRFIAGDTNGFILNSGLGLVMLLLGVYMVAKQVSRLKRLSKNEETLKKTAKHIRVTAEQITNYRVEAAEERKYEWSQVLGVFRRPEEIVICTKKDEQLLTLDKSKLSESEMKFITDLVDQKKLWRQAFSKMTVISIFVIITIAMAGWGVQLITAAL